MLVYYGQPIRTTLAFDEAMSFAGYLLHSLPDVCAFATLYAPADWGYDRFGITLEADEWEPTDGPGLYEVSGEMDLFDD